MATIRQYLRNLKEFRTTILNVQEKTVVEKEPEIIRLNLTNIENYIGTDGNVLKSLNSKFTGFYSLSTEIFAQEQGSLLPKKAGDRYNFIWFGDFASNFVVEIDSTLTKIKIYSTGEGSGEKKDFFKSYEKLYGLKKEDQLWLNNEILKQLQQQARKFI